MMSTLLKILAGLGILVLAAVLAVHTGLARTVFFEIFALVKGEDLLGPTILRNPPERTPYDRWLESARNQMPVFDGLAIHDIGQIPLQPWPEMGEGVNGLYLHFADYQITDGRVLEIPPGGETATQRHLYEKGIYFFASRGYIILQQEGKPLQRIDWGPGDLFSVPLNVLHKIHNSGDVPARMLMVTSFPLVLNVMNSEEFITGDDFAFTDRYDGAPDYAAQVTGLTDVEAVANFVEDVRSADTRQDQRVKNGGEVMRWSMAGNSMLRMHISEIPPRSHLKAHRHSSDAFILLLSGEGYSVAWREGNYDDRIRVDWQAGTVFVPPIFWYHQHFNPGPTPARQLAINVPDLVRNIGLHFGDQLEIDLPEVRKEWESELAKAPREK